MSTPAPPAELVPEAFAERLYAMLAPLAQQDANVSWSLLIYCNAIGTMYELVEDLVRDTPDGPGWSSLLDLERCPSIALPWLAQLVGARIPTGLDDTDARAFVASTDGFRRGTVAAIKGAAAATLTGGKRVLLRERDHDPADTPNYAYYLTVITYTSETPSPSATLAALLAQKPGGIVLTYRVSDGQDYTELRANHATYAAVKSAYATYAAVAADEPG